MKPITGSNAHHEIAFPSVRLLLVVGLIRHPTLPTSGEDAAERNWRMSPVFGIITIFRRPSLRYRRRESSRRFAACGLRSRSRPKSIGPSLNLNTGFRLNLSRPVQYDVQAVTSTAKNDTRSTSFVVANDSPVWMPFIPKTATRIPKLSPTSFNPRYTRPNNRQDSWVHENFHTRCEVV